MNASRNVIRRAELVALVKQPEPLTYDATPKNREQRRLIEREPHRIERRRKSKG